MKKTYLKKFNSVYTSRNCYYGLELRNEFTDYFSKIDIAGHKALDLGCGEGRYSLYLAEKRCSVTAIDRSSAGISKLKKKADKNKLLIHAEVSDIENFVLKENEYDIIVMATVLDHLSERLREQTIKGINHALKPNGIAYLNVFTIEDPGYQLVKDKSKSPDNISDTAECMEYYFQPNELKKSFADLTVIYYYEGVEPDLSHGQPHEHGWACLLAKKELKKNLS